MKSICNDSLMKLKQFKYLLFCIQPAVDISVDFLKSLTLILKLTYAPA